MTLQNAARAAPACADGDPCNDPGRGSWTGAHFSHRPAEIQEFLDRLHAEMSKAQCSADFCECLILGLRKGVLDLEKAKDLFCDLPRVRRAPNPFKETFMEAVMEDAPPRKRGRP
jgi:hypothetical protein